MTFYKKNNGIRSQSLHMYKLQLQPSGVSLGMFCSCLSSVQRYTDHKMLVFPYRYMKNVEIDATSKSVLQIFLKLFVQKDNCIFISIAYSNEGEFCNTSTVELQHCNRRISANDFQGPQVSVFSISCPCFSVIHKMYANPCHPPDVLLISLFSAKSPLIQKKKGQLFSHSQYQLQFRTMVRKRARMTAFNLNSRPSYSVEICKHLFPHPVVQPELGKLFQSLPLWINRKKKNYLNSCLSSVLQFYSSQHSSSWSSFYSWFTTAEIYFFHCILYMYKMVLTLFFMIFISGGNRRRHEDYSSYLVFVFFFPS